MLILKYFIAIMMAFAVSWIPLVGAYDYEASVSTAILGLIWIPILIPKIRNHEEKYLLLKIMLTSCIFWVLANASNILVALLRNELCDFRNGLIYQLLIALPSNILAGLFWGWCSGLSTRKLVKIPVYIFILLLDFGFTLYALYEWPPLIAFGQFFGYFAGSIYDEAIDVYRSLAFYRIGSGVLALCLMMAFYGGWIRKVLMPFAGICLVIGYHIFLSQTGILPPMGRDSVESALWQTVSDSDRHFTIHYQPRVRDRAEVQRQKSRILSEYESDYQYLKAFFGNEPPEPIDIWVYPDAKMKGRYIGAERTSFARVWKNEIHLVEAAPDSTLARHEMAHLFAAGFGNGPLRLSGAYYVPTMGWIEGLAMAAEWPIQTYNLHTWSQAILSNPSTFGEMTLHKILYGFWGMPSRVAYTLAGSYVRYLIDLYGIEKVKQLSNLMPSDFEEILGVDFYTTFENWKNLLNQNYTNENAIHLAPAVYGASSIFNKHCARYKAKLDAAFYQCIGDPFCSWDNLDGLLEKTVLPVCDLRQCQEEEHRIDLATLEKYYRLYMQSGPLNSDISQNAVFSEDVSKRSWKELLSSGSVHLSADQWRTAIFGALNDLDEKDYTPSGRLIWLERSADMLWHSRMNAIAASIYYCMTWMVLPEAMARRIEIKLVASGHPEDPVSEEILYWFTTNRNTDLIAIPERNRDVQIISYLDFVASMNRRDFERAKDAWVRIMLSIGETEPARRMPTRAWTEFFRLTMYL